MIIDSKKYSRLCSCGREHIAETEFSIIESGCLKRLDKYLDEYGLSGIRVAVYDENTYSATADRHPCVDFEVILDPENLHANEHGVELLSERVPKNAAVLIAVGSGTVHDLTRYCAYTMNTDFVSCPTAASVDGFCSSVAAMTWNGCKKTLTAKAPKIVVADTDVFMNAPIRLTRSGFGDMIGKYVALTDWKIASILTGEFFCDMISTLTLDATEAVLESVDGIIKKEPAAYEKLMYGLLLSGLAMQLMGNSRPASGAEHHVSHLIEMRPAGLSVSSDALHGEKVGVGTLMAIEEYLRLSRADSIAFSDYSEFEKSQVYHIFGEAMGEEILAENRHDAASGISADILKAHWNDIKKVIEKLPDIDYLKSVYSKFGVISELSGLGVDAAFKQALLDYSPMVRNRLTLMRLRRAIRV